MALYKTGVRVEEQLRKQCRSDQTKFAPILKLELENLRINLPQTMHANHSQRHMLIHLPPVVSFQSCVEHLEK